MPRTERWVPDGAPNCNEAAVAMPSSLFPLLSRAITISSKRHEAHVRETVSGRGCKTGVRLRVPTTCSCHFVPGVL